MPNGTNFLEKALLVQVETTKVRRILNFENSFEEFKDLAHSAGANVLGEIKGSRNLHLPGISFKEGNWKKSSKKCTKTHLAWLFLIMLCHHHKKDISSAI